MDQAQEVQHGQRTLKQHSEDTPDAASENVASESGPLLPRSPLTQGKQEHVERFVEAWEQTQELSVKQV